MKRKLFLLLPLLTALVFGLIYYLIYEHYANIYKDKLIFDILILFSIYAQFAAFFGCAFAVFRGYTNSPKKENTLATILFMTFTLQPAIVFAGALIFVIIFGSGKAILNYFKNPLVEK